MSTAAVSWVEGALEAASSSESSELRLFEGTSVMMGRVGGRVVDSGAVSVTRWFFFGCGSSTGWDRCLERAGTGMVRVVARGTQVLVYPIWGWQGPALRDGLLLVDGVHFLHYFPSHWCTL